jgi:nitrogen fixation protein FixH
MKRVMHIAVAGMATLTMLFAAACSKQETPQTGTTANAPAQAAAPAPSSTSAAEITFKSEPATPKMGDNAFEVMVMQDGKPVDDAQVSVEFHMPAMPQMNMAEMRTKADLMPMGKGMYQGKGQVMMAGNWEVTVMAMKNGQELGSKKLTVTAK